ncbi:MAG: spondin domain-containing protein, partial [bacterium]
YNTPVWVGFHDGSYDQLTVGEAASAGIERIAEDGDPSVLRGQFMAAQPNGLDGVIFDPAGFAGAPVFDPGNASSAVFDVDPSTQQYFSYASMIIPSNDAFVGNDNPMAYRLFDENGNFSGPVSFVVYGNQVWDAGTEENTEMDAAFLNQMAGDTGVTTSDVIAVHPGFNGSVKNPDGTPQNILGGMTAAGTMIDSVAGDFTRSNNVAMMRITISENKVPVRVTFKNTSPENGLYLTPVWTAFHDGSFDTHTVGEMAMPGLERIAEDGDPSVLSAEFAASGAGQDAVIFDTPGFAGAPVFDPGNSSSELVYVDSMNERYFSFASMVIPSNDAFIGNDGATAFELFDENGHFEGPISIKVPGAMVKDAGTEANTEMDAAFLNQTAGNTGETTSDAIALHAGFNGSIGNPSGTPQNILGGTNAAGKMIDATAGDFTAPGYQIAQLAISEAVDGSFSDNWFVPGREGEGFQVLVVDDNTGKKAIVAWYTYAADGSGDQVWLIGSGPVVGTHVIVDLFSTAGATFGADFDPQSVTSEKWGQIDMDFNGCKTAEVHYVSDLPEYGEGHLEAQRLTFGPSGYQGACQL